jgi:hypothetical protein
MLTLWSGCFSRPTRQGCLVEFFLSKVSDCLEVWVGLATKEKG